VTQGWLTTLTRWLHNPAVGLVGPVTWLYGASNEAALPVHYDSMDEMETVAANYTSQHRGIGFDISVLAMYCVAMRRTVFDEIGPLDEQFEVGMFEDDDYAMRIRQHGYRVICAEDVFVHHVGRASFSQLNEQEYRRIFETNLHRYEAKWNTTWKMHSGRKNLAGVVS
jgi:GT2 family glycosyltransferase